MEDQQANPISQPTPQQPSPTQSQPPLQQETPQQSQTPVQEEPTTNIQSTSPQTTSVIYASFLKRFFASIIDGIIISIVNFSLIMIISLANAVSATGVPDEVAESVAIIISLITVLLSTSVNIGYYVGFLVKKGATPGKMALGLVVVDTEHKKITLTKAALRETIGKFVSGIVLGLGYFWVIWDEKKQGWHDKIAGTVVIEKKSLPQ